MEKKEKMIASIIMVVMLVVGFAGYAMVEKKSEMPVRLLYKTTAGKAFFDHKTHSTDYEIGCTDCHHNYEEGGGEMPPPCIECHYKDADVSPRPEAFHSQCIDCHKKQSGPVKCGECHFM
ncbi:MAG: cytochrome c3 family protein [Syntrophales bacterium]|nr:cytochrome c3 family protein [Syntrophales bacterium]